MKNYRKGIKSTTGKSQKKVRSAKIKARNRADFHDKVKLKSKKEHIIRNI